jgi:hypothetical protein
MNGSENLQKRLVVLIASNNTSKQKRGSQRREARDLLVYKNMDHPTARQIATSLSSYKASQAAKAKPVQSGNADAHATRIRACSPLDRCYVVPSAPALDVINGGLPACETSWNRSGQLTSQRYRS